MIYSFDYRPYQRQFRQPFNTSHGIWKVREGIIIRLRDKLGKVGWGEVVPLPWFGSETLAQGLEFCQQLGKTVTVDNIKAISDRLPACQFGFESALKNLLDVEEIDRTPLNQDINYSYLLPAGKDVLQVWEEISKLNLLPTTLKWKIGVYPINVEIEIFKKLNQVLPLEVKMRLDANGGFSLSEAKQWLQIADKIERVEFLEQPLPPQEFETMLRLSQDYITPLALDESVATIQQLEKSYEQGWRGIFVIKAAIAGSPRRLSQFISQHAIDVVFSSVFETQIGRQATLSLAKELSNKNRAVGFGVNHWFMEDEDQWLMSLLNKF